MVSGDGGFDDWCTSGAGGIGFLVGGEERIEYPPGLARAFHSYPTGYQCSRRMEESNRDIDEQPRNPFQSSTRDFLRQVNRSAGHKKVTRGVLRRSTHQNYRNGGMLNEGDGNGKMIPVGAAAQASSPTPELPKDPTAGKT